MEMSTEEEWDCMRCDDCAGRWISGSNGIDKILTGSPRIRFRALSLQRNISGERAFPWTHALVATLYREHSKLPEGLQDLEQRQ
jgi:hypothetical protein